MADELQESLVALKRGVDIINRDEARRLEQAPSQNAMNAIYDLVRASENVRISKENPKSIDDPLDARKKGEHVWNAGRIAIARLNIPDKDKVDLFRRFVDAQKELRDDLVNPNAIGTGPNLGIATAKMKKLTEIGSEINELETKYGKMNDDDFISWQNTLNVTEFVTSQVKDQLPLEFTNKYKENIAIRELARENLEKAREEYNKVKDTQNFDKIRAAESAIDKAEGRLHTGPIASLDATDAVIQQKVSDVIRQSANPEIASMSDEQRKKLAEAVGEGISRDLESNAGVEIRGHSNGRAVTGAANGAQASEAINGNRPTMPTNDKAPEDTVPSGTAPGRVNAKNQR